MQTDYQVFVEPSEFHVAIGGDPLATTFEIKQGDLLDELKLTLLEPDEKTAVSSFVAEDVVRFHMKESLSGAVLIDAAAAWVSAPAGTVKYLWQAGDTDVAGSYIGEIEVTKDTGGKVQSFPTKKYFRVNITEKLA